ncbi:MAG: isocitrate lyase/PEP mutase family protein, partial [Clostridia bacterium]|nr:isocitrate lyase/PEP mutase family protein [Clostridia bacterium]
IVVLPGAADALTARIIERCGFEALYVTGAGVSYSLLARPDVGLVTMTEMARRVAHIAEAVKIPVVADADTGYGGPLNVARTVREYERAGAAGLQLEDQVWPKRCGHLSDKQVVPVEEMVARIKSALDARTDPDLVIIARTDARAALGLAEAIERANTYAAAGADVIFVEAPQSVEELRFIASAVDAPLLANMVEGGRTPLLSWKELEEIGYRMVIYPNSAIRSAAAAVGRVLKVLREEGTTARCMGEMLLFNELNELLDLPALLEQEARYAF